MAITAKGICKVDHINMEGVGVAKINIANKTTNLQKTKAETVTIPFTITNEIVEFEHHQYRRQSNTILKRIIEPSNDRIKAPCQYFSACGGCLLQHLSEEAYKKFKWDSVQNNLKKFILPSTIVDGLITIKPGLRRRANFKVVKKYDQIYLGFYRYKTHQIVNVDICLVLSEGLNMLIPQLKKFLSAILYDKNEAEIHLLEAFNGVCIEIISNSNLQLNKEYLQKQITVFWNNNNVVSVTIRNKFTDIFHIQKEAPYVKFVDIPVQVNATCFLQPSYQSERILVDIVLKIVKNISLENRQKLLAADLFCGRGTFSIPLSRLMTVNSYELDTNALTTLKSVAATYKLPINSLQRNLFTNPLESSEFNNFDVCIINPPRMGALAQIHQLAKSKLDFIIYVSCNLQTFTKDAGILIKANYELKAVTPIDQFYYSPHLELVALFVKRSNIY